MPKACCLNPEKGGHGKSDEEGGGEELGFNSFSSGQGPSAEEILGITHAGSIPLIGT